MHLSVSVILCTHNPRHDYLLRTVEALQAQTLPKEVWEFLLVDNASATALSAGWDLSWHPRGRHVREEELGLTAARLRGIRESEGALIVFVDDDNILANDFLSVAWDIHCSEQGLGVFGAGKISPEFEIPPAPELHARLPLLALRCTNEVRTSDNFADSASIPWGAGLCVSRQVGREYVSLIGRLNITAAVGRRGHLLLSGEDDLFSLAAVQTHKRFGVFPALTLVHQISALRLDQDYFVRLVRGHAYSHAVINYLVSGCAPQLEARATYLVRILLHGIRNGRFSMRCQSAARLGTLQAIDLICCQGLRPLRFN